MNTDSRSAGEAAMAWKATKTFHGKSASERLMIQFVSNKTINSE